MTTALFHSEAGRTLAHERCRALLRFSPVQLEFLRGVEAQESSRTAQAAQGADIPPSVHRARNAKEATR